MFTYHALAPMFESGFKLTILISSLPANLRTNCLQFSFLVRRFSQSLVVDHLLWRFCHCAFGICHSWHERLAVVPPLPTTHSASSTWRCHTCRIVCRQCQR